MCSLIGSMYKDELKSLVAANAYRGNWTSSFTSIDPITFEHCLERIQGPMNDNIIDLLFIEGKFHVIHMQAPTGISSGIHPAESRAHGLLWHNGLILGCEDPWDTQEVCNDLDNGFECLSGYNGSFACVYLKNQNLYLFRNEISPLFTSNRGSFSSHKIDGFMPLPPNIVLIALNLEQAGFDYWDMGHGHFSTLNNPYDF